MQDFLDWLNQLNNTRLPRTAEQLQNVRDLDLCDCNLTDNDLPLIISSCINLPNLRGINLAKNDIRCLPDEFSHLHIEKLGLCNNPNLLNIRAITNLSNLQHLYLNGNHNVELPDLPHSLKDLRLQDIGLLNLTPILELANLKVLDISINKDICSIDELENLSNLRQIVFDADISMPNWLNNDDWEYKIELIYYYYEIYVFTRKQR